MKDEVDKLLEYFNKKIDSDGKLVGISYEDFMLRYNHALPFLLNEYTLQQSDDFSNRYYDYNYLLADYSYINFTHSWVNVSESQFPAPPRGYVTHEYADLFKRIDWEAFHKNNKDQLFAEKLIALQENIINIKNNVLLTSLWDQFLSSSSNLKEEGIDLSIIKHITYK